MTNQTYPTDKQSLRTSVLKTNPKRHGGYRNLRSYQTTTFIYDLTVEFCNRYMTYPTNKSYRTYDQMVQAARSGRQNIAEGSQASATSKKTEIKLVGGDYLRQHNLKLWEKQSDSEKAANCLICLIHQANYLLDHQLQALEKAFVEQGGYSENLFKKRLEKRYQ